MKIGTIRADEKAAEIHRQSIIVDALNYSNFSNGELLSKVRGAGVTAIHVTLAAFENFRETINNISRWNDSFERFGDLIMPVRTSDDIRQAKKLSKIGIIFGFQNASPIEDDLCLLEIFTQLGVRIIQLTYMYRNLLGNGCLERTDCGLSKYGLEAISEMNRLGLLIDLSHCGDKTTMEAIEASSKPVAFTHANARSLCDVPRNKTDEQIRFLAERGGVIGVAAYPTFVAKEGAPTLEHCLDQIDYLARLVGVDHVGLGLDFVEGQPEGFVNRGLGSNLPKGLVPTTWPWIYPEGIREASDFPNITLGLVKRGYSDADIQKILGGNWLSLFDKVWS
jgi:membrane dipeptidase